MRLTPAVLRRIKPEVLRQAIEEHQRIQKVERLAEKRRRVMVTLHAIEKEMARLEGQTVSVRAPKASRKRRRRFSAETRRRMSEAAKRRYAKSEEPSKPSRKWNMSPEERQRIADAARRRRAAVRAAKETTKPEEVRAE